MNLNIWGDFQICISVPLRKMSLSVLQKKLLITELILFLPLGKVSNTDPSLCKQMRKIVIFRFLPSLGCSFFIFLSIPLLFFLTGFSSFLISGILNLLSECFLRHQFYFLTISLAIKFLSFEIR